MSLSPGTRLGPYEILSPLGAGGMGEVYRAKDTRLGREVAVKVLPASFSQDADRLRRFEQEAKAAGLLNHPNITAVYDIGSHDGAPYVVSELLEGETLRAQLGRGALPPRKATDYAIQIAQGLAAAHEKGIVHRDLKPENLFVTEDGRVKILDFGLAKLIQRDATPAEKTSAPTASAGTEPGVVMGTAAYMSPEQVRGQPVDHRSDIFSFGAVLYEMLAGRRAFHGASTVETMSAILKEDPPDLSESNRSLSPGLGRLVRHCMEKSPAQRFQSARDLAYDLESASVSSGGAPIRDLPRPMYGRRLLFFAAAVLVAAAIASALWISRSRQRLTPLTYRQVTYRRGFVSGARFAPDGHTVFYSAAWLDKPMEVSSTQIGSPESRTLGFPPATLLAVSRSGELALGLGIGTAWYPSDAGTLARVSSSGGSPRELFQEVTFADWSPRGELAIIRRVGGKNRLEFPPGRVLYESYGWIGQTRVSPRGDEVAFIDHPYDGDAPGSVRIVDTKGSVRTLADRFLVVEGLAWSPKGDEVWFTGADTGTRRALRAATLSGRTRLLASSSVGLKLEDVSASGAVLATSESWRAAILGVAPGQSAERDYTWLDFSWALDLSQDGKTLLFEEWGEGGGPQSGVYLRRLDGSDPVRLGDGIGLGLSPDGRWALTLLYTWPSRLLLLPTGPGEPRSVGGEGLAYQLWAQFLPDGKRIAFLAREAGHGNRIYIQDLSGGKPRAITPEGLMVPAVASISVSPDGRLIAGLDPEGRITLYPIDGGEPRPVPGTLHGDTPVRWTSDGQGLFVRRTEGIVMKAFLVRPATGERLPWREFRPSDPVGAADTSLVLSADGKAWFWTHGWRVNELFLLEGVK